MDKKIVKRYYDFMAFNGNDEDRSSILFCYDRQTGKWTPYKEENIGRDISEFESLENVTLTHGIESFSGTMEI